MKNSFIQKIHAHVIGGEFLFWLVPKDAQWKFLQVGKDQTWKTGLWTTKKVKNERSKSCFGLKNCKIIFFFQKYVLAPDTVIFFFQIITKRCAKRVLYVGQTQIWKINLWHTKNLKNISVLRLILKLSR